MLLGILVAGFTGGWVVRSTVDARGLTVKGISAIYDALERGRRIVAIEREHLEDLMAEGRARYEMRRLKPSPVDAMVTRSEVRPIASAQKHERAA
jgi:hypothetical protein